LTVDNLRYSAERVDDPVENSIEFPTVSPTLCPQSALANVTLT
jgi:hypothetical protein